MTRAYQFFAARSRRGRSSACHQSPNHRVAARPRVTNLRPHRIGEAATLTALVEAAQILRDAPDRRFRELTRYAADLVRHSEPWRMRRMVIDGVWSAGEAGALMAR